MSTKTFCDLCDQEIKYKEFTFERGDRRYTLNVKNTIKIGGTWYARSQAAFEHSDVCAKCMVKGLMETYN